LPAPVESFGAADDPGDEKPPETDELPGRVRTLGVGVGAAWSAGPLLVVVLIALAVGGGLLPVALAVLLKALVDSLTADADGFPLLLAMALGGAAALVAAVSHVDDWSQKELQRRLSRTTQARLFDSVVDAADVSLLDRPGFHDRLRLAQQASQSAPSQLLASGIGIFQSVTTTAGFAVALARVDARLCVLSLLLVVPGAVSETTRARQRASLAWDLSPSQRRRFFYGSLIVNRQAAAEVNLYGLGRHLIDRMDAEVAQVNASERALDIRYLRDQCLTAALSAVLIIATVALAVGGVHEGRASVGSLAVVLLSITATQSSAAGGAAQFGLCLQAVMQLQHYVALTGRHRPRPRRVLPPAPALRHAIEFRDVWFRYPDTESWALRGVSLQLSAGNSTALVGVNGSGKSTLVALLCGLQKPTRGTILWDGVDIGHFEPDSLRRRVRAVFQDFVKYEFTAGENIGFGDVERLRDDDAIGRAARLAGVAATVEALPRGYGTQLSHMFALSASKRQHVASLSGGQWQRLAVARALMRDDVDVLILDEPSTGLDAESEASLHERLRAHRRGRCSLLISHRLSAVKCAALIVVLEHGAIVESGSHTELLRSSGIYAKMYALQRDAYEDPEVDDPAISAAAGPGPGGSASARAR